MYGVIINRIRSALKDIPRIDNLQTKLAYRLIETQRLQYVVLLDDSKVALKSIDDYAENRRNEKRVTGRLPEGVV